jgi:hypothetical protein
LKAPATKTVIRALPAKSRATFADSNPAVRLHTYVVEHDFGFAPNPFYGVCTLATCKPKVRKTGQIGDYIAGMGCSKRKRRGYLVYFMRVSEDSDYDKYWADPRFRQKRPQLRGSKMQAFGDNIYHHNRRTGEWIQENSFHSRPNEANPINLEHDTTTSTRVLIGTEFAYFGGIGPKIPKRFRDFDGRDVCGGRGHQCRFPEKLVIEFVAWLKSLGEQGVVGSPLDWPRTK